MSQLSATNATLGFFTDFEKVAHNVASVSISLHTLNYLIGKKDIVQAVHELWARDPSIFKVLGILVAVRKAKDTMVINDACEFVPMDSYFQSPDKVVDFLDGTGLSNVFRNTEIKDLHDYVFGVETGLDTNARKNRSGKINGTNIEHLFTSAGIPHEMEVGSSRYSAVQHELGTDAKDFDFVIETPKCTYLIEVNFYASNGSKLNEVARSFTKIATKVNSVPGFEFVWITDGKGWEGARNKLEEAYNSIPLVYNYTTLPEFIKKVQAELGLPN